MPWFFRDPERLALERTGIEELLRSAGWLIGTEWCLDPGLCLDAVIRAHDHDYELRVSFPILYPDAPAIVRPKNMKQRLSTHQYGGADGPLCLEWGPDNWHRDVTAVQLLESAHRLFDTENPLGEDHPDIPVVAPSRHRLTMGQELRGEWARWHPTAALSHYFAIQPHNSVGSFKFSFRKAGQNRIALIHEAMLIGGSPWRDNEIPTTLPEAESNDQHVGVWFKTELDGRAISSPSKLQELRALLADRDVTNLLATDGTSPVEGFTKWMVAVMIVDRTGQLHLFVIVSGETVIPCTRVRSEAEPVRVRSPESAELDDKTIGIVGLGSSGSKVALSLARMGAKKFYLVDHDVLLPENLQRHVLDWQGVAQHKVDAIRLALDRVAPGSQVEVSRLHLTGQESSAAVSGVLNRLAACDVLIDATANPKVFNLLAALARTENRPMVWMEVFGGGIGGLVARSRPHLDPTPQDMRGAYLRYCADNPPPVLKTSNNYAAETEDGDVLVASDSDVAIIAHHAARFIPDCFAPSNGAKFPYSMYLIGLAKGWTFEAPFDTIPISMASYTVTGWDNAKDTGLGIDNAKFLLDLFERQDNAIDSTSGNSPATS